MCQMGFLVNSVAVWGLPSRAIRKDQRGNKHCVWSQVDKEEEEGGRRRRRKRKKEGSRCSYKDWSLIFKSKLPEFVFCEVDLS